MIPREALVMDLIKRKYGHECGHPWTRMDMRTKVWTHIRVSRIHHMIVSAVLITDISDGRDFMTSMDVMTKVWT